MESVVRRKYSHLNRYVVSKLPNQHFGEEVRRGIPARQVIIIQSAVGAGNATCAVVIHCDEVGVVMTEMLRACFADEHLQRATAFYTGMGT